ncbi:hypothetical protein DFH09DRAFT_1087720 [Mycena vulgaris]|nr:hypothetical protein DFH09DRAFT_1087720 [Mycena vulgaris]
MTNNKKQKKQKTRQRTLTSEITDSGPGSLRSVTDPPPISRSSSGTAAAPDNMGAQQNSGNRRGSPENGSHGRTASSPLPALTTSDRDEGATHSHRPSPPLGPSKNLSQNSRDSRGSGPNPNASARPTLEEVTDEDDQRPSGVRSTRSTNNLMSTGNRDGNQYHPDEIALKLAVVPPTPHHGPSERQMSSERGHRLPGSSPMPSSSPYPQGTQVYEPKASDSLRESDRRARRAEKQRHNHADSIESAELHLAVRNSLADIQDNDASDASSPHQLWNDRNLNAATAALARERLLHESTEVFQRCRAAWARSEQRLREFRVEDDRLMAEELYITQLRESQDRELAEEINLRQQTSARERAEFESRQRTVENYISQERERSRKPRADNSKVDSRWSETRPLLAPGRDLSEEREKAAHRHTHTFADRVILQRIRYADLAAGQSSRIQDQGIDWDEKGTPYEKGPALSRGSLVGFGGVVAIGGVRTNITEPDIDASAEHAGVDQAVRIGVATHAC